MNSKPLHSLDIDPALVEHTQKISTPNIEGFYLSLPSLPSLPSMPSIPKFSDLKSKIKWWHYLIIIIVLILLIRLAFKR
jgi:hypothetical protein